MAASVEPVFSLSTPSAPPDNTGFTLPRSTVQTATRDQFLESYTEDDSEGQLLKHPADASFYDTSERAATYAKWTRELDDESKKEKAKNRKSPNTDDDTY